jgi:hypothetical protein
VEYFALPHFFLQFLDAQDCLKVCLALHELEGGPQFVHLELRALPEGIYR